MRTTSSSTSSSEAPPAGLARGWGRFVVALVAGAIGLLALGYGALVAIDPYDTGRLALLRVPGVPVQSPRTANASRGRDPAYDAAIFGNSHIQLVEPAALSAATGLRFVSLAVPATGPRETFRLLDYWLRHRPGAARALVIGVDPYWCRPDPAMPTWEPFPFWLYGSASEYFRGLLRDSAVGEAFKRVAMAAGLKSRPRARPDGYWNYNERAVWRADVQGPALRDAKPDTQPNETGRFPALDALSAWLAGRPAGLHVLLVMPPVYVTSLPAPGSPLAPSEAACRTAIERVASGGSDVGLLDWRTDRPENRVPENYIDPTHYRTEVATALEADIVAALKRLRMSPDRNRSGSR